ncbi:hypothetical protein D3C77_246890 [compost metagenome]
MFLARLGQVIGRFEPTIAIDLGRQLARLLHQHRPTPLFAPRRREVVEVHQHAPVITGAQQYALLVAVVTDHQGIARLGPERRTLGIAQQHRIAGRHLGQQSVEFRLKRINHHAVLTGDVLHRVLQLVHALGQAQLLFEQTWRNPHPLLRQHGRQRHGRALVGIAAVERHRADFDALRQTILDRGRRLTGAANQRNSQGTGRQQATRGSTGERQWQHEHSLVLMPGRQRPALGCDHRPAEGAGIARQGLRTK